MRGRFTDGVPESEIFHLSVLDKPEPMVPRPLIKEVDERVDYKGAVLVRLDPAQVEKAVAELVSGGVEAIAVMSHLVRGQRQPRAGHRRHHGQRAPRRVSQPLQRGGALPGRVRTHGHHRVQRLHRAADLRLHQAAGRPAPGAGSRGRAAHHAVLRRGSGGGGYRPPTPSAPSSPAPPPGSPAAPGSAGSWTCPTSWPRTWAAPPSRSA